VDYTGLMVVGSGPAGISGAEAFRKHNPDEPICVVTDDSHSPYQRPPLSKEYLRGETDEIELHPAAWFDERGIEVVRDQRVDGIDVAAREVSFAGRRRSFRSLVLCSGSAPKPLPLPGGDSALLLRSREDAITLRTAAQDAQSAVGLGAGFIGCEAAASLSALGVDVTLIAPDAVPQATRLGDAAGQRISAALDYAGVQYVGGVEVQAVVDRGVKLGDGVTLRADSIVAAIGVTPQSALARDAALSTSDSRVLTCDADDDYELAESLIAEGAPIPTA
jgi:NADPH-dependent 2,4-dienoyl-CoA reductase/sulfur reductase-like enzyme